MKQLKNKPESKLPYLLMGLAVLSRFLPHPPNFTAVGATAIYGGRYLKKPANYLVPIGAMLLSDSLLGWHRTIIFVYGAFLLNVFLGTKLAKKPGAANTIGITLIGSLSFFLITNLGVWLVGSWYPKTIEGLASCYVMALPFARWTLLGDLFFVGVLFGATALYNYQKTSITHKEVSYGRSGR